MKETLNQARHDRLSGAPAESKTQRPQRKLESLISSTLRAFSKVPTPEYEYRVEAKDSLAPERLTLVGQPWFLTIGLDGRSALPSRCALTSDGRLLEFLPLELNHLPASQAVNPELPRILDIASEPLHRLSIHIEALQARRADARHERRRQLIGGMVEFMHLKSLVGLQQPEVPEAWLEAEAARADGVPPEALPQEQLQP